MSQIKALNQDNPFEQNNLRFQGQYYDQETELHYNRYRYYEPHSARYVSKDPIGLSGGINTSAYVSDPTQWVDPRGLASNSIGSYGSVKSASDTYEKYATSKSLKDVAERYAAGKTANASIVAGVGFGGSVEYKGDGVTTSTLEQSIGLYGGANISEVVAQAGSRRDGKYVEACGAAIKYKVCGGSNTDKVKPYGSIQKVQGSDIGFKISRGQQTTVDHKAPPTPRPIQVGTWGQHPYDIRLQ